MMPPRKRAHRGGFTFAELMVVVLIIGILASVAITKYVDLSDRARTAKISEEINAIRLAAYNFWADSARQAPEVGPGVVPPEFYPWLGRDYVFDHSQDGYVIDWDNLGGGGPYATGITITATTPRMARVLDQIFGSRIPFYRAGNSLTYVLVGPDGAF